MAHRHGRLTQRMRRRKSRDRPGHASWFSSSCRMTRSIRKCTAPGPRERPSKADVCPEAGLIRAVRAPRILGRLAGSRRRGSARAQITPILGPRRRPVADLQSRGHGSAHGFQRSVNDPTAWIACAGSCQPPIPAARQGRVKLRSRHPLEARLASRRASATPRATADDEGDERDGPRAGRRARADP